MSRRPAGRTLQARRLRAPLAAVLLWSAALAGAAPAPLSEIEALARAGAPGLALRLLDRLQEEAQEQAWDEAEALRLRLLRDSRRWRDLAARAAALPATAGAALAAEAATARAEALLALDDGAGALAVLRERIWGGGAPPQPARLRAWRRLLIRAYLAAGRSRDAHVAMLRFAQDYGEQGPQWLALEARVLMEADRPSEAVRLLEGRREPALRLLRLAALLRAGAAPEALRATVAELAAEPAMAPHGADLRLLEAEAARLAGDLRGRVALLEAQIGAGGEPAVLGGLVPEGGRALWEAYLALGRAEGNRLRLLLGEDASWIAAAADRAGEGPEAARALLAVVVRTGREVAARRRAAGALAALLGSEEAGRRLLRALFLTEGAPPFDDLPGALRAELAEDALARGEVGLASRLLGGEIEPPEGGDPVRWELRRARVLILGGRAEEGAAVLRRLVGTGPALDGESLDRLVQVVFDLQTVGRHAEAAELFDGLLARGVDVQRRRELLFWAAESLAALDRHEEAALRYLRSATIPGPETMDPWAVTARFRAAGELAEAGLFADAARLYRRLLEVAETPARKAVIRRRLHELRLRAVAAGATR